MNIDIGKHLKKLKKKGNKDKARWSKNYLKSNYRFYGVTSKELNSSVNEFYKYNKDLSRKDILNLLYELWNSEWYTEKTFAIKLANKYIDKFNYDDIHFFKKWLDECNGWDHTDQICSFIIGEFIIKYPKIKKVINTWTKSKNLWTRRASLISYIKSVRKKNEDFKDLFQNIEELMFEKDFFIRKAIGWILREGTKKYPLEIKKFVKKNEKYLSNLSKREALRNISKDIN